MQEDYTLLTPENVELRYPIAGVGSRLIAATIDYTVLFTGEIVISFAVFFVAALLGRLFPHVAEDSSVLGMIVGFSSVAFAVLLIFLGWWGYFMLFELLWNGQSPGKRLLGIRVVRADGQPLGAVTSLVRNLLRAIDLTMFIGVLVMLIDASSRRLGDFAAGSLVVRDAGGSGAEGLAAVVLPGVPDARVASFPNAGQLTMQHYILVRDYFARWHEMPPERADRLAADLARRLAAALDIPIAEVGDANEFLAAAARAFEARHARREQ